MTEETATPSPPKWSVIVPYFNERDYIAGSVKSAMTQAGTSLHLILVDNASTDGSEAVARELLAERPDLQVSYLREQKPGQIVALETGFAVVDTPFTAFWDADTHYPPHYLAEAERLLADGRHVVAQAADIYDPPDSVGGWITRVRLRATQKILSRNGHTGSFGQTFRTEALRKAGGPSSPDWPYVLYDHELMHRMFKVGRGTGSLALWAAPAPRRQASSHVRWTVFERLMYDFTPFALKDWFFYRFLAGRFEKRKMVQQNLRIRDW